jgi:hypothetical protein
MAKPSAVVKKQLAALPEFRVPSLAFDEGCADVGSLADRLGRVQAVRAELEGYEKRLKEIVRENGETAIEGRLFRATLSIYDENRLNTDAIRADMTPKWIAKYTVTKSIMKVGVKARLGSGLGEPVAIAAE